MNQNSGPSRLLKKFIRSGRVILATLGEISALDGQVNQNLFGQTIRLIFQQVTKKDLNEVLNHILCTDITESG